MTNNLEWPGTVNALRESNRAKDEIIAALLEDMVEIESSLQHTKLVLLHLREERRKEAKE